MIPYSTWHHTNQLKSAFTLLCKILGSARRRRCSRQGNFDSLVSKNGRRQACVILSKSVAQRKFPNREFKLPAFIRLMCRRAFLFLSCLQKGTKLTPSQVQALKGQLSMLTTHQWRWKRNNKMQTIPRYQRGWWVREPISAQSTATTRA